jgi:flagellar hook assembly protein FlgD
LYNTAARGCSFFEETNAKKMKKVIFITLMISVAWSSYSQTTDISRVEWLTGTWTRTNAKPGRSGAEVWGRKSATELVGHGYNLKGTDTTFVEKIKLVAKDGKLFYVADVPENKAEVWFEITSITEKGFVSENPKHDFPKKISYELKGSQLKATISGDGKSIDYLFVKRN